MFDYSAFQAFSPTVLADCLQRENVMDFGIHPLWTEMPRIAGPAYTVRCGHADNLMVHAAIHRAPAGSVLVVESADMEYAVAGGNVCAVAQQRGIVAFVVDGAIRDLAELRRNRFPVFARGVSPIPGGKEKLDILNDKPVRCGGVWVAPGDYVVADEEGVVIVPFTRCEAVFEKAKRRVEKDAVETLENWSNSHNQRINDILNGKGYTEES